MELTKNYIPAGVEDKWYQYWKEKGYFNSTPDERPAYTVVIPPPNVTGVLHMGHTLNETVQDILIRRARMTGFNACWVPGSDHASIATEAKVVELLRSKGIQKNSLSREEFLKYAFEWKEKYGNIIYKQIEKLGCSVDWNRVSFTMDDHYYEAVIHTFVDLYNKGKIYRGARMINWDPIARTALSDEEVEYRDVQGKLYYVKYPVAGGEAGEWLEIATQRPETIMGDVAVAVNPQDERYAHLRGKKVIVPLIDREIPVIFDEYVDPEFGTGALKITPAHDINDFNLGLKYQLPVIDVLDDTGHLSEEAQIFVGVERFEARKQIVEELRNRGYLLKEEDYTTRIGYSQRTHCVAEPRISTQWFVKMQELAAPALEQVVNGNIQLHPADKFTATYKYWLENVKDWCISRQLWWGQQIPAWYDEDGNVFVAHDEAGARKLYEEKTGKQAGELRRDGDVLDTWFSSWLWPIEVFHGITRPGNSEINYYYPTSSLITGQDIIFFWVARMVMAGMEYMGEKPFKDVYFTGMVRDKQGRKMSKSLGNSPDLLELIDTYGADAVRFGIMISSPAGNDLLFDENSLEQGRHFNNKLWNALKLVRMWEEGAQKNPTTAQDQFAIQWFENRLNEVKAQVNTLLQQFRLSEALKTIYSLIWDDYCSWYLEWVKPAYGTSASAKTVKQTIAFFDELLVLLHPFMPFITEEIYHTLTTRNDDLIVRQVQEPSAVDQSVLKAGNTLREIIGAVREARAKNNLKPKDTISLNAVTQNEALFRQFEGILGRQVNAGTIVYNEVAAQDALAIVCGVEKLFMTAEVEIDYEAQREKLLKDLEYQKGFLASVEKKLSNERFVSNAKPEIVELERKKQSDAREKIGLLEHTLSTLPV